jgi:hypothetical protein
LSTKEKLLEKARRNSRNVSNEEFESLIQLFGYVEEGGSHPKAIISSYTLPYKRESPIKSCYVKELIEIIDSISAQRKKKI